MVVKKTIILIVIIVPIAILGALVLNSATNYKSNIPGLQSNANSSTTAATVTSVNAITKSNGSSLAQSTKNATATSAPNHTINVAFVRPTFTYAAYQLNGFYNFYHKHGETPKGTNVTTDLNLLTVKVPHKPVLGYDDKPSDHVPLPREKEYIDTLIQHVRNNAPAGTNVSVSDLTDKDVHNGLIFSNNGNNAYRILFLFHQEYVTQTEYDNLKQFVANGGTIVFNDANIFTVEVSYNSSDDTVRFIGGHTWQYDGKSAAWRAERERWANETQQWVGSNFMQDPTKDSITFANNPWSYKHAEEQYVTNSNDRIILDFGASEHESTHRDETNNEKVAIYELDSGKGKVISLSIFSYKLGEKQAFLNFYDKVIIPQAFASGFG